ncbi:efflux RND transporter periplasmic adaptor subunit [Luteimonas aestuarii]|nr:efflux RND transporter periplasmic adaptor subunit [Luteimonas aestuarii]
MHGIRRSIVPLLACALLLAACGRDTDDSATPPDPRAEVVARALGEIAAPAGGSAAADVLARNDSVLTSEVAARVSRIGSDAGARVRRGDLLVELDPTDYRLSLSQASAQASAAQARATQAQARLVRARQLNADKYVSDDELAALEAETAGAQAEARVRQAARAVAERELAKTRIVAPFDGVVLERIAQVGAAVAPGSPLLRIVDAAMPEVEVRLPPQQAATLEQLGAAMLEIDGRTWPVTLLRMADAVDATSRTRVARLAFGGDAPPPGSNGTLRWQQAARWRVPADLLVSRDGGLGIFVVEDGRARHVVLPGAQPGRGGETDLPADARIVTEGHQALQDGQAVRVRGAATPANDAAAAAAADPTQAE